MSRVLENELAGDPLTRGYAGMNDATLLTSLNTKDRNRNRASVTGAEVKTQVDATEYAALTDPEKQQFIELIKRDDLDLFGLDKEILVGLFGGGSNTGTNLVAARVEVISRMTELGLPVATDKYLRMHTLSRKVPRS